MGKVIYKHLYGPVPSRRLGRSLGVDIVPFKICSYDCIYCTLGRTTRLTSMPEPLISAADVIQEIKHWLKLGGTADYITFAGSGEPTLNIEIAEMIEGTKKITDIPCAVITNGSLLCEPEIREAVSMADVLLPSLDAGTECAFLAVNRPVSSVTFLETKEGLVQAAQEFSGQIWLEIMLVKGVNDSETELLAMRDIIRRVCPDKLQINTVERPSRSGIAKRVSDETMSRACEIFGASAEIIAGGAIAPADSYQWRHLDQDLVRLLSRRPCTLDDCVTVSGRNVHEIAKHIQRLANKGLIEQIGEVNPYYRCVDETISHGSDVQKFEAHSVRPVAETGEKGPGV